MPPTFDKCMPPHDMPSPQFVPSQEPDTLLPHSISAQGGILCLLYAGWVRLHNLLPRPRLVEIEPSGCMKMRGSLLLFKMASNSAIVGFRLSLRIVFLFKRARLSTKSAPGLRTTFDKRAKITRIRTVYTLTVVDRT